MILFVYLEIPLYSFASRTQLISDTLQNFEMNLDLWKFMLQATWFWSILKLQELILELNFYHAIPLKSITSAARGCGRPNADKNKDLLFNNNSVEHGFSIETTALPSNIWQFFHHWITSVLYEGLSQYPRK